MLDSRSNLICLPLVRRQDEVITASWQFAQRGYRPKRGYRPRWSYRPSTSQQQSL